MVMRPYKAHVKIYLILFFKILMVRESLKIFY